MDIAAGSHCLRPVLLLLRSQRDEALGQAGLDAFHTAIDGPRARHRIPPQKTKHRHRGRQFVMFLQPAETL